MVERNEVAYISPSKCLSRQQELTMQTKWTRSGRIQEMQRNLNQISFHKGSKAKGKGKSKKRKPVPSGRKGMHSRTAKGDQICYGLQPWDMQAGIGMPTQGMFCMFVLCQGATKIILRRSINDSVLKVFHPIQRQNGRSNMWIMDLPRT